MGVGAWTAERMMSSSPCSNPGCQGWLSPQFYQKETEGRSRCRPEQGSWSWELPRQALLSGPGSSAHTRSYTSLASGTVETAEARWYLCPPPLGATGAPSASGRFSCLICKTRSIDYCQGWGWNPLWLPTALRIKHHLCLWLPCSFSQPLLLCTHSSHPLEGPPTLISSRALLRPQTDSPPPRRPRGEHLLSLSGNVSIISSFSQGLN